MAALVALGICVVVGKVAVVTHACHAVSDVDQYAHSVPTHICDVDVEQKGVVVMV